MSVPLLVIADNSKSHRADNYWCKINAKARNTRLYAAGSAAVEVAFRVFRSFFRVRWYVADTSHSKTDHSISLAEVAKRDTRRSVIEAQDGSSMPALNAFGRRTSAEDVNSSGIGFHERIAALLDSWEVQGTASTNVQYVSRRQHEFAP